MQPSPGIVSLRLPADARASHALRDDVGAFARDHFVHDDDIEYFLMALSEAFANAVEHARPIGPIEIDVRVTADGLLGFVRDDGIGFSASAPGAALPSNSSERGRGLPIMRRCCDEFSVERAAGGGTIVRLGRRVSRRVEIPERAAIGA